MLGLGTAELVLLGLVLLVAIVAGVTLLVLFVVRKSR